MLQGISRNPLEVRSGAMTEIEGVRLLELTNWEAANIENVFLYQAVGLKTLNYRPKYH